MSVTARVARHLRLSAKTFVDGERRTPPFLILFINSICNLTCEHCFYWRNLNQRDDLTFEELKALSDELGEFENLNLSGGEPFLRPEFSDICEMFVKKNRVRQIYVPTNGYFTERTEKHVAALLKSTDLQFFVAELSLDGMPEYHNRFRGNERSFEKAMETYEMLAEMQKSDPRLRIHAISTATSENLDQIRALTEYLHDRCPSMDHHNLAMIRGDRKNPALIGPALDAYGKLYSHAAAIWHDREKGRFGSIVEPMLQWAKKRTVETESQFVPCTAGVLTGVVHANGNVAFCETHPPLGNLRQKSFFEIWDSPEAQTLRASIRARACWCTNEVFLWPSVVFQPAQLARAAVAARVWKSPKDR